MKIVTAITNFTKLNGFIEGSLFADGKSILNFSIGFLMT